MKILIITLMMSLSLISTSCSTTRKSIGLGIATGAITGGSAGLAIGGGNSKKTLTGLAIGALVGGIASYFVHKGLEKRDADTRKDTLFNLEKFGVYGQAKSSSSQQAPAFSLSPAVIDHDYVETHVEDGKRLIEGHRIWSISEGSEWVPARKNFRGDK